MIIDPTKPLDLPTQFVRRLNAIDELCREHEFSESLIEVSEISILVRDIDAYCCENDIVGIHFTVTVHSPTSLTLCLQGRPHRVFSESGFPDSRR